MDREHENKVVQNGPVDEAVSGDSYCNDCKILASHESQQSGTDGATINTTFSEDAEVMKSSLRSMSTTFCLKYFDALMKSQKKEFLSARFCRK